jgi:hypothetical protein
VSPRLLPCVVTLAVALVAAECAAIEMFTFFGDGSRIGLPSLEVPVEAYPGIPLRSDRIRMRRRGRRQPPVTAAPGAATTAGGSITLREVPETDDGAPVAPEPE